MTLNNAKVLVTGGSGFIGLNLAGELIRRRIDFINLDTVEPCIDEHQRYWRQGDILNKTDLNSLVSDYQPTHIVHLAARTDTLSDNLDDYRCNYEGTENLLDAIREVPTVRRAIITSTQFVNQYKGAPQHDEDFNPHTTYGESKVLAEKIVRKAKVDFAWTIVRPTNIWGPWHPRYPYEFWRILAKGLYFHPGKQRVLRSYGYVKNVVFQVLKIAAAPREQVDRKVYYVGDEPIDLMEWVNGFAIGQTGRPARIVPSWIIKALGITGDILQMVGVTVPITTSRFKSMTTSNAAPMRSVLEQFGQPPYSLSEGIEETIHWLRQEHPELVSVPPER